MSTYAYVLLVNFTQIIGMTVLYVYMHREEFMMSTLNLYYHYLLRGQDQSKNCTVFSILAIEQVCCMEQYSGWQI